MKDIDLKDSKTKIKVIVATIVLLISMITGHFFLAALIILSIVMPVALTIWNIVNLLSKNKRKPRVALLLTVFIGLIDYAMLYGITYETAGDYNVAVNTMQVHNAISSEYVLSFALPMVLGFIGLIVIGCVPVEKLSPLAAAVSTACIVIAHVVGTFFEIQTWREDELPYILLFYLFHLNMLILSVSHIHRVMKDHIRILNERKTVFRYEWMLKLYPHILKMSQMREFYFFMLFPVAALLEIILILFGQGPDGVVKAFTMTADWRFSTQIPPPPVEYEGHYLCTVAAGGHRNIVKPIRFGKRRGAVIVVNRQLMIANAFEELLQDRLPAFHRKVRKFYDDHGYPLSQVITTPLRADIIYYLMKPLEWVFLVVLYMFDSDPENRINRQYEMKGEDFHV